MFTDEPSPFRPSRGSRSTLITVVIAVIGVAGSYGLAQWKQGRDAADARDKARALAIERASAAAKSATEAGARYESRLRAQALEAAPVDVPEPRRIEPPAPVERTTIYFCKSYGGGTFWSNAVCSSQRATIDRMTTVPGNLSFAQQVAIASGEAQEAAVLYLPPQQTGGAVGIGVTPGNLQRPGECAGLDQEIRELDLRARQPQTASTQDWIRQKRAEARSRQFAIAC
jgi:type II secretory pathway pseudopilin PulG